jgi:hypothetical protein
MMATYTATAAPDDAAVITGADRAGAGVRACVRILFLVSVHNGRRCARRRLTAPLRFLDHD